MNSSVPASSRPRTGARSWRRLIVTALVGALALSSVVVLDAPPADAAVQAIAFEAPNNNRVVLGALASRSQKKPVSISGIGPYTIRGTDSATQEPYEFTTDYNYAASTSAWTRESDERAPSSGQFTSNFNATFAGRSGVRQMSSNLQCPGNSTSGNITYCSVFGPDVYTAPFQATAGQAVSFDWAAQKISDDYEIYAYLVRVTGNGYGTPADHTLLTYGRGDTQGWTTTSRNIPADGTYRFRFVNGSYDKTGGLALGSNMYIDSVVRLGLSNPITFAGLADKVLGAQPFPVTATAPGGAVGFSTTTTQVCTVSNGVVTLTGNTGVCTITANQAGDADHVPAETVARSFRVLAAPTAPTNAGRPFVEGSVGTGETITANEGTWTDGGSAITGTSFQWVSTVGGVSTSIPGETAASCFLVPSPGSSLHVVVTKTNAIGSTSATSTPISGYACGQPAAPQWSAQSLGDIVVGVATSVTFSAAGVPAPTYTLASGALPAGLTFNAASGVVSGTPTVTGPYEFTLRATNAGGSDDLVVAGTVNAAPGPITGAPDAFVVGTAATGSVSATGTPAPGYLVTAGALPAGVNLDPVTGDFSGTPTAAGPYSFTVTADNGIGTATTREYTGSVVQAPGWEASTGLSAEVGVPVDVTFTAAGGPSPTYAIGSGALPAGLTLDSATGRVTGTPTEPGPFAFTIVATNSVGSASLEVEGTVVQAPGPITGGPGTWIVGETATGSVDAEGTPAPVYSVTSGTLPAGVTLDPTTGAFSGSPTAPGAYTFTVTADNGIGTPSTREYTGDVVQAPAWGAVEGLAFEVGVASQEVLTATGAPAPVYAIVDGALPAGITLDAATGALIGTPTEAGPYAFTIAASNGVGAPAELDVTGVVNAAPTWRDVALATPRVGVAYSDGIAADGTPAPGYSVTAGTLPPGLALNPLTGALTGTPTEYGTFTFTVTADNGVGTAAAQEFTLEVVQSPTTVRTPALPALRTGTAFSVDLSSAVSSSPAPTYRVTAGELPAGVTLDPVTGRLSGTPTAAGRYAFTITVDNGTGEVVTFDFEGVVAAAPGDAQGDGVLANSGSTPDGALLVGSLMLLCLGALMVVVRRRRRTS